MASVGARPRHTQEERTAITRAKLLEATIESLLEGGYAATTTRRVAELAGVSQGAQTHHFRYRVDLVAAAIEHLAERRIDDLSRQVRRLEPDPVERLPAVLDLLWADFSGPLFMVFVKVWVAAADDKELHQRLVPIERVLARAIQREVSAMMGDLPHPPDFEARLTIVLATMRGLSLTQRFEPRAERGRDPWPAVRETLISSLVADA